MSSDCSQVVGTKINNHTFTVDAKYSFQQQKILGIGSYGVVTSAYDTLAKRNIAIKRIRQFEEDAKLFLRELRCLQLLGNHPNVYHTYLV